MWFDVIACGEGDSRMRVNAVRFSPCARTAWNSHSLGQTLHVTEGIGIVATRDQVMTHLAMWEDDDATWGDHVTDDDYDAAAAQAKP